MVLTGAPSTAGDVSPGALRLLIAAGMLIFVDGRDRPEYVLWADIERIEDDFGRVG